MIFHDVVPRSDLRQEVHSPDTWPWARDENRNLCQYTWKQMRHTHICIYNIHAVYHVWSMNVIMQHMNLIWIYIYKHMYKTHTYIYACIYWNMWVSWFSTNPYYSDGRYLKTAGIFAKELVPRNALGQYQDHSHCASMETVELFLSEKTWPPYCLLNSAPKVTTFRVL